MFKKIRSILFDFYPLLKGIWSDCRKIFPLIELPNRRRKGNLLSVILSLFVALSGQLADFCRGIPAIYRSGFMSRSRLLLRRGVLLTGCFLFLASSLEWTAQATPGMKEPTSLITHIPLRQGGQSSQPTQSQPYRLTASEIRTPGFGNSLVQPCIPPGRFSVPVQKKYLLQRHLSI
ncbi:MAG TPA: hypothetical protein VNE41_12525 [Chitinophagaceae bacterium]|nr:hypothetical protein [Chitinophagaceae bacterium]